MDERKIINNYLFHLETKVFNARRAILKNALNTEVFRIERIVFKLSTARDELEIDALTKPIGKKKQPNKNKHKTQRKKRTPDN